MTTTRIALAQMTSGIDPEANLAAIARSAGAARAGGAAMLFLPEMAVLLDRDRERSAAHITAQSASPWPARLGAIAAAHGLWLHAGSVPFASADGMRRVNRSLIFPPDGRLAAHYDKIHMFDVDLPTGESWRESAAFDGGDALAVVETPAGRLGLSVCFDLRFPELYAALADAGALLLAVPAAFTVPTGAAHWHLLLRARAVETGSWVIAAAQGGTHADGRQTFGHSLVVDPWGTIVAEADHADAALIFAEIDADAAARARAAIPLGMSRAARRWVV